MAAKPTARNSRITASLIPTISVLTHDDSCTPITSTTVINPTMASAGKQKTMGMGPRWGAEATIAGFASPEMVSVTSHRGSVTPMPRRNESK